MEISYKRITKGRNNGNHSETANDFRGWCDWVIERSHAWINRSRRLLVRWEKKVENYLAFLHLACAQLIFAKVAVFG